MAADQVRQTEVESGRSCVVARDAVDFATPGIAFSVATRKPSCMQRSADNASRRVQEVVKVKCRSVASRASTRQSTVRASLTEPPPLDEDRRDFSLGKARRHLRCGEISRLRIRQSSLQLKRPDEINNRPRVANDLSRIFLYLFALFQSLAIGTNSRPTLPRRESQGSRGILV